MSTRVSLMTSGSRANARSIGMLSDGLILSPRPVKVSPGIRRTPAHSASLGSRSIVERPQTAGALRMTPSTSGDRRAALAGHRDDRHRPAHALAEQIERHAWDRCGAACALAVAASAASAARPGQGPRSGAAPKPR